MAVAPRTRLGVLRPARRARRVELDPLGVPPLARLGARLVPEQRERVLGMGLVEDGDERAVPAAARQQVRRLDRAQVRRLVRLEMEIGLVQAVQASDDDALSALTTGAFSRSRGHSR